MTVPVLGIATQGETLAGARMMTRDTIGRLIESLAKGGEEVAVEPRLLGRMDTGWPLNNDTLLVVGYGSLMSGWGLLAERRGGSSRLLARDAFAVQLDNARRGLAKPSSHGSYLAMDLEPTAPGRPITAAVGTSRATGCGAIVYEFGREMAAAIARREEYEPGKFADLIALADRARKPLGDFILEIARRSAFDLLAYRRELRDLLGYTSPGYIFHPLPLSDGRVAIVAIGSGYEGSGDPAIPSRRSEFGVDRLLGLAEALRCESMEVDRDGQLGYFVECILGGIHGIPVADLVAAVDPDSEVGCEVARRFRFAAARERECFLLATSLSAARYRERFVGPDPSLAPLLRSGPPC